MRIIAMLADGLLSLVAPRITAAAESCWEVSCGCINHVEYLKLCCPGSCTSCVPTSVSC